MIKYSDSPKSREKWKKLEEVTSPEFVEAMKDLYSIYDYELFEWVAKLYDPKIGGWYYSDSARDNEKCVWKEKEYTLLPDAESTCQALGFIGASGISLGKNYEDFLPEVMKKEIGDYIYSLQDPDGFFYHPQWGKNIGLSRRARDFNWSIGMLKRLGREKKYPTMLDKPEEKKEEKTETLIPDHLKSKEAFIEQYISDYRSLKNEAEKHGITALFGIELRFQENKNDYLVLGIGEDALSRVYDAVEGGLSRFRETFPSENVLILQAHPDRDGIEHADAAYLDGAEVFNLYPGYNPHTTATAKWAKQSNLSILVGGSDLHHAGGEGACLLRTKERPDSMESLVSILKSKDFALEIGGSIVLP
jgi:hypothetical protein